MQQSRRDFVKKSALVTAGVATVATSSVMASSSNEDESDLIKGSSRKKEILYRKTATWEEYYKQAK